MTALLVSAVAAVVLVASPPAAFARVDAACGAPLSEGAIADIVRLSDTTSLTGSTLQRLETAVEQHRQITDILVRHRDRRGLLALGLDTVEQTAVMPLQRNPAVFDDPEFAHRISLDLLLRFLRNVHAEFTGAATEPQWAHYFALTRDCGLSAARVAMAGYNAHLTVDLANAVAAVRATPANAPDYFRIVDAIALKGSLIVEATKTINGGDLGPLWRFYFLGEGLDAVFGAGVGSGALLRLADAGANVVIFGNGLALQDPALEPATRAEIDALWRSADAAFVVLAANGGL
ncbi:DUF5995 family protein [Nocardia cyriacigeorgica]|uniref:Uncharacterized protein n=1 Tax=Nocardia cyriacigeorgica (strain GUH-2) TaxID=1127134 RepID=H6R9G7_NOCCG|nr:DUF5995 family protein [Nocardia cyriacigeorgica]MBF6288563.1 hypothetical protein [Nocardia cyriacigeorgica]CCF64948.1 conserved exported protein of unknown function [Nocardia cyriacigeorgica GUH-2]